MYVLTGNTTYLDAMLNAWSMLRSHWILPGGSITINEGDYYPPDSHYIGSTNRNIGHKHLVRRCCATCRVGGAEPVPLWRVSPWRRAAGRASWCIQRRRRRLLPRAVHAEPDDASTRYGNGRLGAVSYRALAVTSFYRRDVVAP
jgi:hypothetical protein